MRRCRCTSEIDGRRVFSTTCTAWSYIGSASASAASTTQRVVAIAVAGAGEDALDILRLALAAQVLDDAMHFGVGDERAMHALRIAGAGRQVQHVALPQQRFGAHLVEDRPRIDLARHLEGDARRDVGLDEAGDHVDVGRCVARIRWMPAARAFCAMRAISSSIFLPVTIIRSASSSTTTTISGISSSGSGSSGFSGAGLVSGLPAFLASATFWL